MSKKNSRKLLIGILLTVIIFVSGYFAFDKAFADHSRDQGCYAGCHTLFTGTGQAGNTTSLTTTAINNEVLSGATVLCEVCHQCKNAEFSLGSRQIASGHPVHVMLNPVKAPIYSGGYLSDHSASYKSNLSTYIIANPNNSIECFNCHNSNFVTDRGPDSVANGYPDHRYEIKQLNTPNPALTYAPPYDYLLYQLYGGPNESHDYQLEDTTTNPGNPDYGNDNFVTCYGGANLLNKGGLQTINTGPTANNYVFPGCHNEGGLPDSTVESLTIQDYYEGTASALAAGLDGGNDGKQWGHTIQADRDLKIACFFCHNAHRPTADNLRLYEGPKNTGSPFGALTNVNQMCRDCHAYDPTLSADPNYYAREQLTVPTRNEITGIGSDTVVLPVFPPASVAAHGMEADQFNPIEGVETCYTCHNAHKPTVPPDTYIPCQTCHLTAITATSDTVNEDVDRQNGAATTLPNLKPMIDGDQWLILSHGTFSANPPVDNFPVTNKDIDTQPNGKLGPNMTCAGDVIEKAADGTTTGNLAGGCHTYTVNHLTEANPYKLRGLNGGVYNAAAPDAICTSNDAGVYSCHDVPDGLTNPSWHDKANMYVEGVCFDCHDPHGDSVGETDDTQPNGSMIQRAPAFNLTGRWVVGPTYGDAVGNTFAISGYQATSNQSDFVDNGATSGICEVCHTSTSTRYFRRADADGGDELNKSYHNDPTNQCTNCHEHVTKFEPPAACTGCHSGAVDALPVGNGRPAIVWYDSSTGEYHYTEDGASMAGSRHSIGGNVTPFECVVCHLEGDLTLVSGTSYTLSLNATYHLTAEGGLIDLRDQATGGEAIIGGYDPTNVDAQGYPIDAYLLNSTLCGGCHDSDGAAWWGTNMNGNAMTPFDNSTLDIGGKFGGNDTTAIDDVNRPLDMWTRYSNTGTTNYSKYNPGTYNVVPQLVKAYSPHGNPASNTTKSENAGEGTSATFANPVACVHCHTPHGSDTLSASAPLVTYTNLGANPVMTRFQEPQLCWNCHSVPAANVWDFYGDEDRTSATPLQWGTNALTAAPDGVWTRAGSFSYKEATISSIHPVRGPRVPADNPNRTFCSVCHDPHGVDTTGGHVPFMVPALRTSTADTGGWMTSPYKEDRAGQKNGTVFAEGLEDYSGNTWSGAGSSYTTDLQWADLGTGPRVEPVNITGADANGGTGVGRFDFNNPVGIGGGYGDASGGGAGHDGYFLNDNTFGTNNGMMGNQDVRGPPNTIDPFTAIEAGTGATSINFEQKFGGFCDNCHNGGAFNEYGGWSGHHSVYGHTAANDVYNASIAQYPHGGPVDDGNRKGNIWVAATGRGAGDAQSMNKWAMVMGVYGTTGNWQNNPGGKVNYHEFTCSKCHTPHASVINKIMRTNCLSGATDSFNPTAGQPSYINTNKSPTWPAPITDTARGNFTFSASANRPQRNYTFPGMPTDFSEAFAMHCHNSNDFASGTNPGWGMANGGFNGGWLKLGAGTFVGGCSSTTCHAFEQTTMSQGAHQTHINSADYGMNDWANVNCTTCHMYQGGSTGVADNPRSGTHANGAVNFISPNDSLMAATTVCDQCHTAAGAVEAKANWTSGLRLTCTGCHNNGSNPIAVQGGVQAAAILGDAPVGDITSTGGNYGFYVNGHGLRSLDLYGSGDNGAGFTGDPTGCKYCHNDMATHIDGNTARGSAGFRFNTVNLPGVTTVTSVCNSCHEADPTTGAYLPGLNASAATLPTNAVLSHTSANMTAAGYAPFRDWTAYWPAAPNQAIVVECHDCHDLHGSSNIYMIGSNHNALVPSVNAYLSTSGNHNNTQIDYNVQTELGRTGLPNDGPCVTCHTLTSANTNTSTDNLHASGGGDQTGAVCTQCHKHNKAMKPSGCNACHGWPPGSDNEPSLACPPALVGAVEELPSTGEECNINAVEAGAHVLHTLGNTALTDGEGNPYSGAPHNYGAATAELGKPKLGFTCLNEGCHVTTLDHNTTVDYTAEVAFDLLDNVTKDPIITKDPTTGENYGVLGTLGDGFEDTKIDDVTPTGGPNPASTPMGCQNIYCHSAGVKTDTVLQPTLDIFLTSVTYPVTWNNVDSVYCGTCHNDMQTTPVVSAKPATMGHTGSIMVTGSHQKHVDTTTGNYTFVCTDCHLDRGRTDAASTVYHVDGVVDLNISTTVGAIVVAGTFNGTGVNQTVPHVAGVGYGNCNNVYCHSNGFEAKNGLPAQTYQNPTWGAGTLACTACHGAVGTSVQGEPDYTNTGAGLAEANSHEAHIVNLGAQCNDCHDLTIVDGPTNTIDVAAGAHVNGTVNVVSATYAFAYDQTVGVKRCMDSCHGSFVDPLLAPQWGGTEPPPPPYYGSCFMCHAGAEADPRPVPLTASNPGANKIDKVQYFAQGHGNNTGYTSGNGGAAFWTDPYNQFAIPPVPGCVSTSGVPANPTDGCHNFASAAAAPDGYKNHWTQKQAGLINDDNFYLTDAYKQSIDGLCNVCHIAGISRDAITHASSTTGSILDWDAGEGGTNTWATNPPKCIDCHDPHGDGNDYMVKYAIFTNGSSSDTTVGTSDYGAPLGTMRNVTLDISITKDNTDYYNTSGNDGICQICHTQNLVYNNVATGVKEHSFLSTGGAGRPCADCHLHSDGGGTLDSGFKVPSIDFSINPNPLCTDCHLWDPNGSAGGHPLMVSTAIGGLLENLADSTDQNDDIDNYVFGTQPVLPALADYTDRAMIDGSQYLNLAHGVSIVNGLPETSKGVNSNAPPNLGCVGTKTTGPPDSLVGGCHDESTTNHGTDPVNPYRLHVMGTTAVPTPAPEDIVTALCNSCHVNDPDNPLYGSAGFDPRIHEDPALDFNMYPESACTDCHDPHGDTSNVNGALTGISDVSYNAAMIQRELVFKDRWTLGVFADPTDGGGVSKLYPVSRFFIAVPGVPAATDFVKNTTYSGVCEACHTAGTTQYFRRNNADGGGEQAVTYHNGSLLCTSCHKHPAGFKPPPPCDCYSCHEGVMTQFSSGYSKTPPGEVDSCPPGGADGTHTIAYDPTYLPPGNGLIAEDCATQDCLKCHDLDTNGNHTDQTVYLLAIDGGAAITSPSVYFENGTSIADIDYGNIKTADPTGAWCGQCHDGVVSAAANINADINAPPDTYTNFLTTGHGASDNASGNFTRVAPNDATGRASCTACHNYHGVADPGGSKAMVRRTGFAYPAFDDSLAITVPPTAVDSKELFCLEACHLSADPEWTDVATARPGAIRAHFVYNYAGNLGTYADKSNPNFYFISKAVGFVMGGTDFANSKYVADDLGSGEQVTFNESASSLANSLPMQYNTVSDTGRLVCASCHNPHGSQIDSTWGHVDSVSTDDNMLRDLEYCSGTDYNTMTGAPLPELDQYLPCFACHPSGP